MRKVTITFQYDETIDGALTEDEIDEIFDVVNQFGSEVSIEEEDC